MEYNESKHVKSKESAVHKLFRNPKLPFYLAVSSGVSALIAGLTALVTQWSTIIFNSNSSSSIYNQLLSVATSMNLSVNTTALQQYVTDYIVPGKIALQQSLLLFIPLILIAGVFMIVSALYLKSKSGEARKLGTIMTIIFPMFVFLGLLVFLPFNAGTVAIIFSYLSFNSVTISASSVAVYAFFLAYIILGLLSPISELLPK